MATYKLCDFCHRGGPADDPPVAVWSWAVSRVSFDVCDSCSATVTLGDARMHVTKLALDEDAGKRARPV